MLALEMGQVEELLIAAHPDALRAAPAASDTPAPTGIETSATDATDADVDPKRLQVADDLVTEAQATSARIRFIENQDLLREVGGVGALLRFRI